MFDSRHRQEMYEEGLTSIDSPQYITPPPWLSSLGWDNEGIWVVVPLKELSKVSPGLEVYSAHEVYAVNTITLVPEQPGLFGPILSRLTETDLPLFAYASNVTLNFAGGIITQNVAGTWYLTGPQTLTAEVPALKRHLEFKLPQKLRLIRPPGSIMKNDGTDIVAPFKVTARLTADSEVATAVNSTFVGMELEEAVNESPVNKPSMRASFLTRSWKSKR
jgi:hypothetical protein